MLILWIRKSKENKQREDKKTDDSAFRKHDAHMKKFRESHPDLSVLNTSDIVMTNGDVLAQVSGYRTAKNVQN